MIIAAYEHTYIVLVCISPLLLIKIQHTEAHSILVYSLVSIVHLWGWCLAAVLWLGCCPWCKTQPSMWWSHTPATQLQLVASGQTSWAAIKPPAGFFIIWAKNISIFMVPSLPRITLRHVWHWNSCCNDYWCMVCRMYGQLATAGLV